MITIKRKKKERNKKKQTEGEIGLKTVSKQKKSETSPC